MNDKQQIEEMAKIINRNINTVWYEDMEKAAEALYNTGYRKIPEGSVVLTKEEFDEDYVTKQDRDFWKYKAKMYKQQIIQARKETAREILKKLCNDFPYVKGLSTSNYSINKKLNELAKQYGCEIKGE